jgi:ABC-type polysaccharide/polyol phosphate transport system ATPase subunit
MAIPIIQLQQVAHRFERSRSFGERIATVASGIKQPSTLHALRAINLELRYGEILGLVGETGSG